MCGTIVAVEENGDITVITEDSQPLKYASTLSLMKKGNDTPIPVPPPNQQYKRNGYTYPDFQWPTVTQFVTQAFGANPQIYGQWGLPGHEGIDMRGALGTQISAVWNGKVVQNNSTQHRAYGWHIRIEHIINNIKYWSVYCHLVTRSPLSVGSPVEKGHVVGSSGSTGNSTGPHLHFMLKQYGDEPKPVTTMQNPVNKLWPYNLADPTFFFPNLR